MTKKRFHLWIPNIFDFKGGIQVYSAFFLEALQALYPQDQYDVFLKHDVREPDRDGYLPQTRFHFVGRWPLSVRTLMFSLQIVSQALLKRPDLIIATHLNFAVAAYWLKRFAGIPYWAVAHGVEAWDIQNPHLKVALLQADRILCVSCYTRDRLLREQSLDPDRVAILPNTFDASRFQIKPKPLFLLERHGLSSEQPIILTVSRLVQSEQYKGYERILSALPLIRQVIPNIHYLIVGKGDDRPRIEQMMHDLRVRDCTTLAGYIPDEELCDYYNLCDVFAMPSKREGFGIVYLEALSCGKPALGGNQDGAIDALCQGKLGVLVNPDDVKEIAQILIQILQKKHPNSLLYKPEQLRQAVIKQFCFESFQQALKLQLEDRFPLVHL
ncbi:glycosyltransferase [Altericista sp. CCNU0014]|uniref:glycosyltransferase n=1 Tax=Altericista sp. CCNU0014 TaxID=3082949 RepID=UPI00384B2EF1